ncbi:hypothetical protein RB620_13735 [Paenibacillus sp. LHD-117]|uniref:hypothetical protein n=1 Tax=Paenibacillus sp. LHD-117 TaxID=3071412 RepID=UPI0027E003E8|nr:hypothetical protein [Paenibacillus sp. LHD-117]MDQ6420498.1 hypothetical protein [Paenibacillus sp. LHD-117]
MNWKGSIPNHEGFTISLESPVTSNQFRILIDGADGEDDKFAIQEIHMNGYSATDKTELNRSILIAEQLLAEGAASSYGETSVDVLQLDLRNAKYIAEKVRASANEIAEATAALRDTLSYFNPSQHHPIRRRQI